MPSGYMFSSKVHFYIVANIIDIIISVDCFSIAIITYIVIFVSFMSYMDIILLTLHYTLLKSKMQLLSVMMDLRKPALSTKDPLSTSVTTSGYISLDMTRPIPMLTCL